MLAVRLFGSFGLSNQRTVMCKPITILSAVVAICLLTAWSAVVLAEPNLAGTSWSSPSDTGCGIDISFNRDGTAMVSKTHLLLTHRDTAHWTQEGSELHLTYDTWQGGI
jgi:hypothetical protein